MIDAATSSHSVNSLINQVDISGLPQRISQAIKTAATKTGVDFSYLMHKASQESGFDPNAKATTSSATGLFQFTNQTWLRTLKDHGAQYGLGSYTDHIKTDNNGVAHVSDPTWRQAILNLRKDPQISAEMAGELDKENMGSLKANVGGKIGATDLYLAHFLGAGGASDFLNEMKANPNAKAATVLPDAAASNPSVFYSASGEPRSLKQIYAHFAQKFDGPSATIQVADTSAATAKAATLATKYQSTATSNYTLASAASPDDTSSANYTSAVMSGIKANTSSSLMATMILAQMNTNAQTAKTSLAGPDENKKNAISILGSFA